MAFIIVGSILVLVAAVSAFAVVLERRSIQRMTTTETISAADLAELREAAVTAGGEGSFGHPAEVAGVVRFGPDGPLTSQLTKTECVWHRHKVERKYKERRGERTHKKTETLTSHRTDEPFYLEDSTGRVLVRPSVSVDKPRKAFDEFREPLADALPTGAGGFASVRGVVAAFGDRDDTIGFRSREWVLEEGTRVYVLGEASDLGDEVVVGEPSGPEPLVISTRSESELGSDHGRQGVIYLLGGLACLIGGVALIVLGATAGGG